MFSKVLIRFFDIIFVIFLSPVLLPLILFIGFLIFLLDGRPIFFFQARLGKNQNEFSIIKFRSMHHSSEQDIITNLGRILRRTSLDELPQFFNILFGQMSIVGPRPLPKSSLSNIPLSDIIVRSSVRPGLTGLSQIMYKGKSRTIEEKIVLDLKFIKNYSISNYFKIIFATFSVILRRAKYNQSGKSL